MLWYALAEIVVIVPLASLYVRRPNSSSRLRRLILPAARRARLGLLIWFSA
jgi:hypothetical protein